MNKIDVVVVTYNRLDLLRECLDSLIKQKENIDNIYVINNNSTDGTRDYLKKIEKDPFFCIKNLSSNVGGAKGFEIGVKAAYKGTGKYVWIMDDDTIPTSDASTKLLEAASGLQGKFGFLCSNVKWVNGDPTNIPLVSKTWTSRVEQGLVSVQNATFVSILITKQSIKRYGLPLGDMKIWGDDTEYTTRLTQGGESFLVSTSIVIHKTGSNLSNDQVFNISNERLWRIKVLYRNLFFINRKFHSKKSLFKFLLKATWDIFTCFKAKSNKVKRMIYIVEGIFQGICFSPEINFPE